MAENAKIQIIAITYKRDGSHIVRATTNTGMDVPALLDSVPILGPMIEEARNGYPAMQGLTRVLKNLDNKYDILENKRSVHNPLGRSLEQAASNAASNWKEACRQLLQLRKDGIIIPEKSLQSIIDMIDVTSKNVDAMPACMSPLESQLVAADSSARPSHHRR